MFENVWVKRVITVLVFAYAIYLLYRNYRSLAVAISTLIINPLLAILSSFIIIVTFLLSVSAWRFIVTSFGFNYKWMEMAHVQMLSSIGKYIPGSIWNYSSKIFLSKKLGIPLQTSSLAIIAEVISTYLAAICLSLFFFPIEVLPNLSNATILLVKIFGSAIFIIGLLLPLTIKKSPRISTFVKEPKYLCYAFLLRIGIWMLSGLGFVLIIRALGFLNITLPTAIATITISFFISFLAIIIPDGLIIRETIIVFMLQNLVNSSDAIILSVIYRFLLIFLEFLTILIFFLLWKFREIRHNNKNKNA